MSVESGEFVKVAKYSDLSERRGKKIRSGDLEIALWRVGATVYAINNVCAHQHLSMMHDGARDGLRVICPMHGWSYSLETGRAIEGNGRLDIYPVEIRGDDVFVYLPKDS